MIWKYQNILGPKNHTRKISKIDKGFELCQVFMHNLLYQNIRIFALYILLTRRINTFWSKAIDRFWSGDIKTFCVQKITEEKSTKG